MALVVNIYVVLGSEDGQDFAIFHSSRVTPELIDLLKSIVRGIDTYKVTGIR